jgi:DNA-binding CsgD family transcriptional regulator
VAKPRTKLGAKAAEAGALYASLGVAAEHIGAADFHRQLMQSVGSLIAADLAMVMRYSQSSAPEYVVYDDLVPLHMEYYLRGLYRVDPVYRLCREPGVRGVYNLDDVCTPEERAGEYFSIFLRLTGMADDLVILFPAAAGTTIGLVYERRKVFSRREVEGLRKVYPLLAGMHAAHTRHALTGPSDQEQQLGRDGLPPLNYRQALERFLEGRLTPREREIVRLILLGFPTAKVAERLGLSVNTIKNHKKRLYFKLDITTERELFTNFVSFLFQED